MFGPGTLLPYFDLRQMPTGRRRFTITATQRTVAEEAEFREFRDFLAQAAAHDEKTHQLEREWARVRANRSTKRGDAGIIDAEIDIQVAAMEMILRANSRGDDDDPDIQVARQLHQTLFPRGYGAITQLPFEEQLIALEDLLKVIDSELKPLLVIGGIERQVQRLRPLVQRFRDELLAFQGRSVVWEDVVAANQQGHENMAGLVARAIGLFPGTDAESTLRRETILAEFNRQQEIVREANRRRRQVRDVDPETGAEVDDEATEDSLPAA